MPAVVSGRIAERVPGGDEIGLDIQRLCRREEHERVGIGPVQPHFPERFDERRGERAQQRLVEERHIHPLNEDTVVIQVLAHLAHELERVEVRGACSPGVRGLRDDCVVSAAREVERAARVVGDEDEPRVEQRIALAQRRRRAIRRDDFRLELDDIDLVHRRRHRVDDNAAAITHHQHALGFGTRDDCQWREPELAAESG